MTGLLIKDFFSIRKTAAFMILLSILYTVLGALPSGFDSSFSSAFCFLYMSVLPSTALMLEEKSHWGEYAVMLPVSRWKMVAEKYLLAVICLLLSVVIYLGCNFTSRAVGPAVISNRDLFQLTEVGLCVGMLLPSVGLPWVFALGMAKGRIFMLGTTALIAGGIGGLIGAFGEEGSILPMLGRLGGDPALILLGIMAVVFCLSMLLSMGLYQRRKL